MGCVILFILSNPNLEIKLKNTPPDLINHFSTILRIIGETNSLNLSSMLKITLTDNYMETLNEVEKFFGKQGDNFGTTSEKSIGGSLHYRLSKNEHLELIIILNQLTIIKVDNSFRSIVYHELCHAHDLNNFTLLLSSSRSLKKKQKDMLFPNIWFFWTEYYAIRKSFHTMPPNMILDILTGTVTKLFKWKDLQQTLGVLNGGKTSKKTNFVNKNVSPFLYSLATCLALLDGFTDVTKDLKNYILDSMELKIKQEPDYDASDSSIGSLDLWVESSLRKLPFISNLIDLRATLNLIYLGYETTETVDNYIDLGKSLVKLKQSLRL
jgi:hypothetical protein